MALPLVYITLLLFTSCVVIHRIAGNDINDNCSGYTRRTSVNIQDPTQREFVNCLGKTVDSGKSDLIVLIDGSGSMLWNGVDGFDVSKKFVKALLGEVRIAFNATRIAVGTFSTHHQINFDYVSKPDFGNHKCKFNADFRKIPFDRQLTDLKGPLTDAHDVLFAVANSEKLSQRRSNKVVMLLTDGYGNVINGRYSSAGRNARPEATKLKGIGYVTLYTVAVTSGADEQQLKEIATHKSSFLKTDTFTDLEKLASNIRGGETFLVPFFCFSICRCLFVFPSLVCFIKTNFRSYETFHKNNI